MIASHAEPSRFLITGAAGFIGRHLAVALEARGNEVVGIDNMSVEQLQEYGGACLVVKDVHDLSHDDLAGVDIVVHLASAKNVPRSFGEPQTYASNASMALHLLKTAHTAGVSRVLIGSTCEVYGDQGGGPLPEALPVFPRSPYAASKAAMEMAARVYQLAHKEAGSPGITIVRIFNVYGPGERADALIPSFCHAALNFGRLPIEGHGRQRRDFTFIDDAVDDLITALPSSRNVLNLGCGTTASVLEIAELVRGHVSGVTIEHHAERPNEIASFRSNRGCKECRSRIGLGEGIGRTVAWWRRQIADNPRFGDRDSIAVQKYSATEPKEENVHS
ncbi:NAD-dependent epimerase/dehydratase family protein [Nocardia transvalensis]|uniref:NAD-dependent epimerase/dehydratase family protein n=1 Tax=Nocardia transvalensis TaxID=37333 RepID=UPI0018961EE6|nr:NAD-dependent epimerase/dehydratase family protein [Nocardia transvalensis]MBF6330879.1 NAD-dependent epimerase/dehydratase family protein [Nocardia transvalensis]